MIITVFGFVVTSPGGGAQVQGRVYKEYHLQDYSTWLRSRVKDPKNWYKIRGCILGSKTCAKVASWTPVDYLRNDMTPVQVSNSSYFHHFFAFNLFILPI